MKTADITAFFATLAAANPQPNTELEYTNVFELLAAVLLSAQATDVGVNKATRRLFVVANTPAKVRALGLPALTVTSAPSACSAPRRRTCSRPAGC